jgi:flagellar biosynthesis/type III secretory pathway chaperone
MSDKMITLVMRQRKLNMRKELLMQRLATAANVLLEMMHTTFNI